LTFTFFDEDFHGDPFSKRNSVHPCWEVIQDAVMAPLTLSPHYRPNRSS
jgi:hypothetical protein